MAMLNWLKRCLPGSLSGKRSKRSLANVAKVHDGIAGNNPNGIVAPESGRQT
jgi:hypothetical protein